MELFKNFKDLWRGVALALVISVPAWLLGKQFEVIGGPVFAILIGMALGLVLRRRSGVVEATSAGIKYTSKKILQYAEKYLVCPFEYCLDICLGNNDKEEK